jgi:hypothetical protein
MIKPIEPKQKKTHEEAECKPDEHARKKKKLLKATPSNTCSTHRAEVTS